MRIRSIRPEFWRSDDIAALSLPDRLLFIGLWSYVDDNGVGLDRLADIAADLFAQDLEADFQECYGRVRGGLDTLSDRGLISRYAVDGRHYLHITAWAKHQRIEKPSRARYPTPTCTDAIFREPSPTTPGGLPEGSPLGEGEKGRRGEGEKGTETASPSRAARSTGSTGTRLPDDFSVTADLREWARANAPTCGPRDHEAFCDYWRSIPGPKGRKLDWPATWRNWMRREHDKRSAVTAPKPSTTDQRVGAALALAARYESEDTATHALVGGAA